MDKNVASSIIAIAKEMDISLGKLFDLIKQVEDEVTRARFDRAVGDLMGQIARELIFPIEEIYPELNPDA